jgi:quercetin dioxygenase-like cupin family protein
MKKLGLTAAARGAVVANASRPATATLIDTTDLRLIVFRLAPGQSVPLHTSPSSVLLTVLHGAGSIMGADREESVAEGEAVFFGPSEPHGMRARTEEFHLLACITPRPGERSRDAVAPS